MDADKLLSAAYEMRFRALPPGGSMEFRIISGSMRPLISVGDRIVAQRVPPSAISAGDVIVWWSPNAEGHIAHRVVSIKSSGGTPVYVTQGDVNPHPDPAPVLFDEGIAKVIRIHKTFPPVVISLESRPGRMFSSAIVLLKRFALGASRAATGLYALCIHARALALRRKNGFDDTCLAGYALGISVEGWQRRSAAGRALLASLPPGTAGAIADLCVGGYSEEAMALRRSGVPVASIALTGDTNAVRCATIIAADILTMLPAEKQRAAVYRMINGRLMPGGTLVVTCSGRRTPPDEPLGVKLRSLLHAVACPQLGYEDPFTGHYIAAGRIVRYALSLEQMCGELERAGFIVEQHEQAGNAWAIGAVSPQA